MDEKSGNHKPYIDDGRLGINLPPERQTYDPFFLYKSACTDPPGESCADAGCPLHGPGEYHGATCSHPHNQPYNNECSVWWLKGSWRWTAAHTNLGTTA